MQLRKPHVVIVGRPNVGKSTLFNRIVGRRVAVVEDTPGVTRDRLYVDATHKGKPITFVDTGGILFGDEDPLVEQIRVQAEVAMAEADVILFIVDSVDGVSAGDFELADRLRGATVPILVVANKTDNPKREGLASEFYELGLGEVFSVSGVHGRGIRDLMDKVIELLPEAPEGEEIEDEEIKLAIVGRPNVGKSSLLNAFTGEQRAIVSNIPGTTRDAIDTLIEHKGQKFRLIDTAGLRRKGKIQGTVEYYMALRSSQAVQRADCALTVIDAAEGLTDGDKRTAKLAHDEGKALVLAVNKWDLKEAEENQGPKKSLLKKDFIKIIRDQHPEVRYAAVAFTSAEQGKGLGAVLDEVAKAVENWSFRISTGALNRLIQDAVFERPYSTKGKSLRIYYATQVTSRPPTFVLFVNDPDLVHFSYLRYLENKLRAQYPLDGTPIRMFARARTRRDERGDD